MAGDQELVQTSESFQKLDETQWSECISHCASSTMSDLKYNKAAKLPLINDVLKLHKHLDKLGESATMTLKEQATGPNSSNLTKIRLTKIELFNRRRVGEVHDTSVQRQF